MSNLLSKASIRTTDYVCAIGLSSEDLEVMRDSSKALVTSWNNRLKGCRHVDHPSALDEDAFDKVVAQYNVSVFAAPELTSQKDVNNQMFQAIEGLFSPVEHLGMVLITDIPQLSDSSIGYDPHDIVRFLKQKGIFETWILSENKKNFDILFKYRQWK